MTDNDTMEAETATIVAAVEDVASGAVGELGLELVEIVVKGPVGRRIVRIVVDGDDGIDVDAVAALSRLVSDELDELDDAIQGAWTLEVTSPGVDRPLTKPAHWSRNVGRNVHIVHVAGEGETPRESTGKLAEADEQQVIVNIKGRMVTIAFDDIERARVVLPW